MLSAAGLLGSGVGSATGSTLGLPREGIFESCPFDQAMDLCLERLDVIHQGGFAVVVVPAWGASLDSLQEYAAAAGVRGMSVMWELSNPAWWEQPATSTSLAGTFSSFAQACGCDQNGPLLSYVVGWLGSLTATYGYYAVDDWMLAPGDRSGVADYVAQIKQQDPAHLVMIGSGDQAETDRYQAIPDAIGTMIYPMTTGPLMPVRAHDEMWGAVAQEVTDAQRSANGADKQSAFILQAFTWGDNLGDGVAIGDCSPTEDAWACYHKFDYPSGRAQRELRDEVLLHAHPELILWWSFPGTYGQAGYDTYTIYPTGATADARWTGLTRAIGAPPPIAIEARTRLERRRRRFAGKRRWLYSFWWRATPRWPVAPRSRPAR